VKLVSIHNVYGTWPVLVVIQTNKEAILELSLEELKEGNYECADLIWKQLAEEYKIFQYSYH
jgi:hypothetical protein